MGTVRELMGVKEAAAELGVRASNLDRIVGLPEPAYAPYYEPPWRLSAGRFWVADEIRQFAEQRRQRLSRV
jgi:hypothetical protein